jgi:hypothetical protein
MVARHLSSCSVRTPRESTMCVRRLFSYAVLLAVMIGVLTVVVITIDRGTAWWPTDRWIHYCQRYC